MDILRKYFDNEKYLWMLEDMKIFAKKKIRFHEECWCLIKFSAKFVTRKFSKFVEILCYQEHK